MRLFARRTNSASPDRRHNVTLSRLATLIVKVSSLTLPEAAWGGCRGIFENGRTTAEGLKRGRPTTTRMRHGLSMRRYRFRSTAATGATAPSCVPGRQAHINAAAASCGRAAADVTTGVSIQHSDMRRSVRLARGVGDSRRVAGRSPARSSRFAYPSAGLNEPAAVDRKERVV